MERRQPGSPSALSAASSISVRPPRCRSCFPLRAILLVDWDEPADVRVVNTCTVTAKSDRTCRREIRAAKRLDPGCVVAVTGCYAQIDPDAVATIPGVDLVLGNIDKLRLPAHLGDHLARRPDGRMREACASQTSTCVSSYPDHSRFRRRVLHPFLRIYPRLSQDPDRMRFQVCLLRHPFGQRTGP